MITYQYPVVRLYGDDPEDNEVVYQSGCVIPINLDKEPYEANILAESSSFHIVFGHHSNGLFVCVVNRHTGCEFSDLQDLSENTAALLDNELLMNYEEVIAVVHALKELDHYIN